MGDINYTADAFVRDHGIVLLRAGWLLSSQFHPAAYFLFVGRIEFLGVGGYFCVWHRHIRLAGPCVNKKKAGLWLAGHCQQEKPKAVIGCRPNSEGIKAWIASCVLAT